MHGSECCFQREQSDVVFMKFQTSYVAIVLKMVFYSVFVWKCTDMCKHRFRVQLLQNTPLCSSIFLFHACFISGISPGSPGGHQGLRDAWLRDRIRESCRRISGTVNAYYYMMAVRVQRFIT